MKEQNCYDLYWRLGAHTMQTKVEMIAKIEALGYSSFKSSSTKAELAKFLQRPDRGLICYENCSTEELRKFGVARQIYAAGGDYWSEVIPGSRTLTIELLMRDDENPRFTRFLDLPAELRNRIYGMYDSCFDEYLINPTKPPLAQTCRQMKQEVLPIFYANHEFEIKIIRLRKDAPKPRGETPVFREDRDTQMFLHSLSGTDAGNIRRLRLLVNDRYKNGKMYYPYGVAGTVSITLFRSGDRSGKLQIKPTNTGEFLVQWDQHRISLLKSELQKVLKRLRRSGEWRSFRLQDIHNLRKAVGAGYRSANEGSRGEQT